MLAGMLQGKKLKEIHFLRLFPKPSILRYSILQ